MGKYYDNDAFVLIYSYYFAIIAEYYKGKFDHYKILGLHNFPSLNGFQITK